MELLDWRRDLIVRRHRPRRHAVRGRRRRAPVGVCGCRSDADQHREPDSVEQRVWLLDSNRYAFPESDGVEQRVVYGYAVAVGDELCVAVPHGLGLEQRILKRVRERHDHGVSERDWL